MRFETIKHWCVIFSLICLNISIAQTHYYLFNKSDRQHYSIRDNYLPPKNLTQSSTNSIKLDSLISTSVQGSGHKLIFQYNENAKISEWLLLFNMGFGWEKDLNYYRVYDLNNNLICEIELGWSSYSNSWDSLSRHNYFYDGGKLFYSEFQFFDEGQWINWDRDYYGFDEFGNLIGILSQNWVDNKWQYRYSTSYYYTNKLDSILFQTMDSGIWRNEWKTIFYYKENEIDLDSAVGKSWNGTSWVNSLKREILNDENHNQIEQLEKVWDNGRWLNSILYQTTYNKYNLMESSQCKLWQSNNWIDGDAPIYFENSEDFRVAFITNKLYVYYSEIVDVDDHINPGSNGFSLSQNYPNPFNPTTTISYSVDKTVFVSLKIYDILGNEIKTLVNEDKEPGTYKVSFNSSEIALPSGVYYYRLQAGNFSQSKKMILLK